MIHSLCFALNYEYVSAYCSLLPLLPVAIKTTTTWYFIYYYYDCPTVDYRILCFLSQLNKGKVCEYLCNWLALIDWKNISLLPSDVSCRIISAFSSEAMRTWFIDRPALLQRLMGATNVNPLSKLLTIVISELPVEVSPTPHIHCHLKLQFVDK